MPAFEVEQRHDHRQAHHERRGHDRDDADRNAEPRQAEAFLLVAPLELLLSRQGALEVFDFCTARDAAIVRERRGVREAARRAEDLLVSDGHGDLTD